MNTKDRNPLIIPEQDAPKKRGCPVCGHEDYTGRRIGGVIHFTCTSKTCGNKWQGGLPQEPQDPRVPRPPQNPMDRRSVEVGQDSKGQPVELRRAVNLTQDFRKGALVPPGEEDV